MKKTLGFPKRILSAVLAVILAFGVIVISPPATAEAAGSSPITDTVIRKRINELNSKLGGTYWNTKHKRSQCGKKCPDHGSTCCANYKIINQTWFKEMFKFKKDLSTNQFPRTYTAGSYIYPAASSCAGFASFAEWYIFRTSDSASVSTKKIGTFKSTKKNWTNHAQVGDLIRMGGHSFIYISNNKNGIKVLDCNFSGKDENGKPAYNCMVQIHTIKYSYSSTFTISRSSVRATCKHTSGYQTEWDGSTYVATVCKKCGAAFKYSVTDASGTAKTTGLAKICEEPYGDAPVIYSVICPKQVKILGKVTNAYGNLWYKVTYTYGGKDYTGFIFKSNLTAFTCPDPTPPVCP